MQQNILSLKQKLCVLLILWMPSHEGHYYGVKKKEVWKFTYQGVCKWGLIANRLFR